MIAIGLVLAALIGIVLGLLGGGGSILTVPVLVYALGVEAKPAIAMSLAVVGITSLVGATMHWRLGHVHVRSALAFGSLAMVGAFVGAQLAASVSGTTQLALLAIVMLAAAVAMLRGTSGPRETEAGAAPRGALLVPTALAIGLLTGVVGIGGGFLIVPALVLLARLPMRHAVGTSLLAIAMTSASGFVGHLGAVDIDRSFVAAFTAAAVAGVFVGTRLVAHVPAAALRRGFAVFLLAIGAFVLYGNRDAFRPVALTPSSDGAPATRVVAR